MKDDTFYSYSIKLTGFLILKNQVPYKVITDKEGKFIFLFPDKWKCEQILKEYRLIKEVL